MIFLSFILLAFPILADSIQLERPHYGGSACPAGSVSATLSPDEKSLSLVFDSFVVEAGGSTGKTVDRKSCNLAIPVHVPKGMSVTLFAIRQYGFNDLPNGASSRINTELFFAGVRGPTMSKDFHGPLNSGYQLSENFAAWSPIWTLCGQDVTLRINSSILVRTNAANQHALSMADQIGSPGGLVYSLQWRECQVTQ